MKFTIKTIGCKVNTYESNKIKDKLIKDGFIYIDVDSKDEYKDLDFYIVNTCSVTNVADKKSRQMIHLVRKYNRNVKVIAIGCLVNSVNLKDTDEEKMLGADYTLSNAEKLKLPELLNSLREKELSVKQQSNQTKERDEIVKPPTFQSVRSFIKIQDGCDEYCTYCLIPYLRGHIQSRDEKEIINEITEKVKNGTKEVVLTGIHISSYGVDKKNLAYENNGAIDIARESLLSLIKDIANIKIETYDTVKELLRIRLGSLEPRIIDERFLEELTKIEKFCESFCLSLQSGSDKILKAMNRHYNTSDFEKACILIRKYMPDSTITADVIVGFPGETIDDFNDSLQFVKKMRFYNPNIFPYSIRKGTKAATFENQLTFKEKHDRSVKMIKECEKISKELEDIFANEKALKKQECIRNVLYDKEFDASRLVGTLIDDVLIEEIKKENDVSYAIGYTKNYIKKKIPIPLSLLTFKS